MTTKTKFKGLHTQKLEPGSLPKDQGGPIDVPPSVKKMADETLAQQMASGPIETRLALVQSIAELADRVATLKRKEVDQRAELEGAYQQRSRLLARGSTQAKEDVIAVAQLRYDLDCLPGTIAELEKQLRERQKELAQFDNEQKMNAQKGRVAQLQVLSGKLLEQLEVALNTNRQLRATWDTYFAANLSVDTSKTTGGSLGMLVAMVETFEGEIKRNAPRGPVGWSRNIPL